MPTWLEITVAAIAVSSGLIGFWRSFAAIKEANEAKIGAKVAQDRAEEAVVQAKRAADALESIQENGRRQEMERTIDRIQDRLNGK